MIKVLLQGHDYQYEVLELLKIFMKPTDIDFIDCEALVDYQSFLLVNELYEKERQIQIHSTIRKNNEILRQDIRSIEKKDLDAINLNREIKKSIKLSIYEVISYTYGKFSEWGILTGIRPTKIVHELMDHNHTTIEIDHILKDRYKINEEKRKLLLDVAVVERPFIVNNKSDQVSLYISIPFCPTRCVYCSFPSNPLNQGHKPIARYMEALLYEIVEVTALLKDFGKKIETLYIGGGTPTSLNAVNINKIMSTISKNIDLTTLKEFTVEAGRPDTIDREKLEILKSYGVNRISINPQTMNTQTLQQIGRDHSPKEITEAFWLAKEIGFKTINMDVIVGLPGEGCTEVADTMKALEELSPENITVHTLAIKRASNLREKLNDYQLAMEKQAKDMLKITKEYTYKMGMIPYYLYRQKFMVGNLENTGYCKPGHECIYNIQIMEERQSILAMGAGAISKIVYPEENRLERVPNLTNVDQYIQRVKEMVERKRKELMNS
ncbi:coproporphyrinogen dehydrogenase HemZ [Geosporobacter ferrireducens]|uniref:Coproporphyrinogen dehydrogenase HemZ n=1 Tax=Geosporobacter ferrireducens TaxID=1424294 RepID=A0A1D8GPE5_9FIRM|nr:coproporphyrinogen dehydrogenase HemZ [Geosporobacter ferrireducens]AOT72829.1 coproporphyrinogen dehydrogenase HemZ [Geosporobacter ferrireducens]MTI55227.1 coproporphyrinogen dehydrogenase HemZ [Geosporobacter ferrireducens]